jgi:hypothetical protein
MRESFASVAHAEDTADGTDRSEGAIPAVCELDIGPTIT